MYAPTTHIACWVVVRKILVLQGFCSVGADRHAAHGACVWRMDLSSCTAVSDVFMIDVCEAQEDLPIINLCVRGRCVGEALHATERLGQHNKQNTSKL